MTWDSGGVDDEIYNPNCDRRRIDRNARFFSGYGGSPSTTTRAGLELDRVVRWPECRGQHGQG